MKIKRNYTVLNKCYYMHACACNFSTFDLEFIYNCIKKLIPLAYWPIAIGSIGILLPSIIELKSRFEFF